MSKKAHIVAIRAGSLGDLGFGISAHPGDVSHILEGEVWVAPRPLLEEDMNFVQPIPYIMLRRGGKVLAYRRAGGNEARLRDRVSIGFGGHVDASDAVYDTDGVIDLGKTLQASAHREIHEELNATLASCLSGDDFQWTHVISSDATPVDEVHIGLVVVVDITSFKLFEATFEEGIADAKWREPWALLAEHNAGEIELESWSKLVLNSMVMN